MTATTGTCGRCGATGSYLQPLHGELGGPLWCPFCIGNWQGQHGAEARKQARIHALHLGFSLEEIPGELYLDLLIDTLKLTHPDKHPPEMKELADSVTARLNELKPFLQQRPPPREQNEVGLLSNVESIGSARSLQANVTWEIDEKGRFIACGHCRKLRLAPGEYCDTCRAAWDRWLVRTEAEARAKNAAYQRSRRAKKRDGQGNLVVPIECVQCGEEFVTLRKDQKYCSSRCRVAAHRARKKA